MSDILLFKDDVVYGGASKFNSETEDTEHYFAAFNVKTKEWTIYGRKYSTYSLSKSNGYANNSIRFVDCASDDENAETSDNNTDGEAVGGDKFKMANLIAIVGNSGSGKSEGC